jgi:subtilase family serine protease
MLRSRIVSIPVALAVALAGCGGGGGSSPLTPHTGGQAVAPAQPSNLSVSPSFFYDLNTLKKATYVGPANVRALGVDVQLRMQSLPGLLQYAKSVSNPTSANYRHYITPQAIGQQYGASQADIQAATKYFTAAGAKVASWPQGMMLHVTGTVPQLESAFHTTFGLYKLAGKTVIGPTTTPSVGVSAVVGSSNLVVSSNRFQAANLGGTVNGTGYAPQQIAAAFDFDGAYNAGFTGSGITIGVIGTGPVAVSGVDGIRTGDVEAIRAAYHVRGTSTVVLRPVGDAAAGNAYAAAGFSTPPPVSNAGCNGPTGPYNPVTFFPSSEAPFQYNGQWCNQEDGETQIDTEAQALLAPDVTVNYYLGYNPNDACGGDVVAPASCPPGSGIPLQGLAETDPEIQQAIAENTIDAVSLSFGESETDVTFYTAGNSTTVPYSSFINAEMAALAVEGIATFVSSGDHGSAECNGSGPSFASNALCVSSPASDPSVTPVGGVTLPLNAAGQLVGPMTAWGVQTEGPFGAGSGSGGGISFLNPTPYYQSGVSYYVPGSSPVPLTAGRGIPDLSLLGDPQTGVSVFVNSDSSLGGPSTPQQYGGTSVAAPEMAAMWALVLQACKTTPSCNVASGAKSYRLGNPNPLLYKIYGGGKSSQYPATFYDVQYGTNSLGCGKGGAAAPCPTSPAGLLPGYFAGPGYSLVTGIGAPYARALIKAVVGV